ncbi:hypothetical protein HOLleu_12189 [Holothuria leucospilota]|uniref:Uncharacterized protein n=1 Tax=Holothuria leucospilota TaxID=206669 RepID=A0A9Q1C9U8_HOLLE|nr:hypothetical protein HOLleu_12189 [Holothuria leucospilota]
MHPPTSKADLVPCLEALAPRPHDTPKAVVCILDGAALVHQLEPKKCNRVVRTFGDYAQKQFLLYIVRKLNEKTLLCKRWLFQRGKHCLQPMKKRLNQSPLLMFLKFNHVHTKRLIREWCFMLGMHISRGTEVSSFMQTDTDVVALAIAMASKIGGCAMWLAFGHGKNFRHIAAHTFSTHIGPERSWGLLFLHAVSGCDTVSAISGIGKKTVWDIWNSMPNLGKVFSRLSHAPAEVTNDDMDNIEGFFVVLYSRTSSLN